MYGTIIKFSILCAIRLRSASATSPHAGDSCDGRLSDSTCRSSPVEAWEAEESTAAKMEMLQTNRQTLARHPAESSKIEPAPKKIKKDTPAEGLVSTDHNGKLCMLCGKPKADRVNRTYSEFRTDCGDLSSPTGPNASILSKPSATLLELNSDTEKNGFCQLNFAKSCVDAVANRDYLYWAKSIDLKADGLDGNAAWDGRYCRLNGFLEPGIVALQHDFEATKARASELCKTKYAKHLNNITFKDMMAAARYDDKAAPTLDEAERLAAWNCAMGDLGCDLALCAYSFCQKGSSTGVYDECQGWHPVHGMPAPKAL